jgi:hypothetical protein
VALTYGNGAENGKGVCQGAGQVAWLVALGREIWPDSTVLGEGPWLAAKDVVDALQGLVDTDIVIVALAVNAALAFVRPMGRRTASEFQRAAGAAMSAQSTMDCERDAGATVADVVL